MFFHILKDMFPFSKELRRHIYLTPSATTFVFFFAKTGTKVGALTFFALLFNKDDGLAAASDDNDGQSAIVSNLSRADSSRRPFASLFIFCDCTNKFLAM